MSDNSQQATSEHGASARILLSAGAALLAALLLCVVFSWDRETVAQPVALQSFKAVLALSAAWLLVAGVFLGTRWRHVSIGFRWTIPLLSLLIVIGCVLIPLHQRHSRPLESPPYACFPDSPIPAAHVLDGSFDIIRKVKQLPEPVRRWYTEVNGARPVMADPGEDFESTDVIYDESVPRMRLVFAGRSGETVFVHYEQGGFGLSENVAAFKIRGTAADPLWRRYCPRSATDLKDLRHMVAQGECPQESDWNRGLTCKQ